MLKLGREGGQKGVMKVGDGRMWVDNNRAVGETGVLVSNNLLQGTCHTEGTEVVKGVVEVLGG